MMGGVLGPERESSATITAWSRGCRSEPRRVSIRRLREDSAPGDSRSPGAQGIRNHAIPRKFTI
ncbi:hypothetical protein E2C01_071078 [Portunus trituberculatus]|uniref:Uncharacterized protein n=1 Tax=Portunus trituberculatus TaxID=210409 RepID=A0A5B7I758_PORTR|nr:hypothetical protein [Portunus trituberculatus]